RRRGCAGSRRRSRLVELPMATGCSGPSKSIQDVARTYDQPAPDESLDDRADNSARDVVRRFICPEAPELPYVQLESDLVDANVSRFNGRLHEEIDAEQPLADALDNLVIPVVCLL